MRRNYLFVGYLLLVIFFHIAFSLHISFSQTEENFRYWTRRHGLYESFCVGLSVSPLDRILIGHGDAVRFEIFDGFTFKHIPQIKIFDPIIETKEGDIWTFVYIGISNKSSGGLARYDYQNSVWEHHYISDLESITGRVPFCPVMKNYVLLLLDNKIIIYNASNKQKKIIFTSDPKSLGTFISLSNYEKNKIFIGCVNGIIKIEFFTEDNHLQYNKTEIIKNHNFSRYDKLYTFNVDDLLFTAVRNKDNTKCLFFYNNNILSEIWEASSDELMALPTYESTIFWKIEGDQDFKNYSLSKIHKKSEKIVTNNNRILSSQLRSIDIDDNGSLWLTTSSGIGRCSNSLWDKPIEFTNFVESCHAICEDQNGTIWFACTNKLIKLDIKDQMYSYSYPEGTYYDIYRNTGLASLSPYGKILVLLESTVDKKIVLFDIISESYSEIHHPKGYLFGNFTIASPTEVIISCMDKEKVYLDLFDGKNFKTIIEKKGDWEIQRTWKSSISDVYYENDTILICGNAGVAEIKNNYYKVLDDKFVSCIAKTSDNKFWFTGINVFMSDGVSIKKIDYDFDESFCVIESNNGSIWIGSRNGIYRKHNNSWIHYNQNDGLTDSTVQILFEDSRGVIWAGTDSGIYRYNPSSDRDSPKVMIEPSNLNQVSPDGKIQVLFRGIDKWNYCEPQNLLFSYKFDNNPWSSYNTNLMASASGLNYGDHVFYVRCMDKNLNVSDIVTWNFIVLKPWYMNIYVITLISMLFAAILFSLLMHIKNYFSLNHIVQERTMNLSQLNDELIQKQEKLQSMALELSMTEERERRKIATDLHDRIGQALALCQIQIEAIRSHSNDSNIIQKMNELRNGLLKTIQDTKQLTLEISPPILYELGIQAAIEWLKDEFQDKYDLEIEIRCQDDFDWIKDDIRSFLYRCIRELLINVIKHANATYVLITLSVDSQFILFSVLDNGNGFSPIQNKAKKGYGLYTIEERLKVLNGSLTIKSNIENGSIVEIKIPIDQIRRENYVC